MVKVNESFKKALERASNLLGQDSAKVTEDYVKSVEQNQARRTNAVTDIMSTSNVGYGAEAMVEQVYTDELYSMISEMPGLLAMLPANHGQKQGAVVTVDVIGEVDLFKTATEPTGSQTFVSNTTNNAMATGKVDITVKSFRSIFAISKRALHDSIGGSSAFYSKIQNRILLGLKRTIEAYLINGDPTLLETPVNLANINFFDTDNSVVMPTDAYWLGGNGLIRYEGIANGIVGGNVAFGRGQLLNAMAMIPDYLDDFDKLLWIMSGKSQVKARGLAQYSTQDVFGQQATNTQGGRIMMLEGIETYTAKDMPQAVGVSGKVEVGGAAANNFETMSLIHKYAPQYVFGNDMEFVVTEDSQRIFFDVSAWFGAAIVDEKAGLGKTVAQLVYQA